MRRELGYSNEDGREISRKWKRGSTVSVAMVSHKDGDGLVVTTMLIFH